MNPRDNLKRLDIVIMLLTMTGMALAAFKTVVTVIALYMLATLDIRKNMKELLFINLTKNMVLLNL